MLPHLCVLVPASRVANDELWWRLTTPRSPRTRIRSCNHAQRNEHTKGEFQCTTAARYFERSQVIEGGEGTHLCLALATFFTGL